MIVDLAWSEVALAASVGLHRNLRALQDARAPRYGAPDGEESWSLHIAGAIGEYVVAKVLGVHWNPSVGIRGRSDVGADDGPPVQVRTTGYRDGHLIVNEPDDDDDPFILVVDLCSTGSARFDVVGYIYGDEAKRDEWRREIEGRGAKYFVPQSALEPIESIL